MRWTLAAGEPLVPERWHGEDADRVPPDSRRELPANARSTGAPRERGPAPLLRRAAPEEPLLLRALRALLPPARYEQLRAWRRRPRPIRWGSLRRLAPVSRVWGRDRGPVLDRHYIEAFLQRCRDDIRGDVLEVGDDRYTRRFGGGRVRRVDVLHATEGNPQATLVGDLASGAGIPVEAYDCLILTQVLQCIYDLRSAVRTAYRALRPGGVLLVTLPGITPVSRYDMERWGDYWRFTSLAAARLFEECLPDAEVTVRAYGNVLVAAAFLYGLSAADLRPEELAHHDPDYELLIAARVAKPSRPAREEG